MGNKKEFGESIMFTITNYIWWFILGNFYFWLVNIPFIFVFFVTVTIGGGQLNVLLALSAIPIGPALTALFSVMGKLVRENDIDITKDFFKAYKTNFFEALFFWTLELLIIMVLYVDKLYVISKLNIPALQVVFIVLSFICMAMNFYVFPIISRFYLKKPDIIRLSFYYFIKRVYISIIGFAAIYCIWIISTKITSMIILVSVSILCYIIMFFQRNTLQNIEENVGYREGISS
jgi:uncharacterized membrane protein YesL